MTACIEPGTPSIPVPRLHHRCHYYSCTQLLSRHYRLSVSQPHHLGSEGGTPIIVYLIERPVEGLSNPTSVSAFWDMITTRPR